MFFTTCPLQLAPLDWQALRAQPQVRCTKFTRHSPESITELVLSLGARRKYDAHAVADALGITLRHVQPLPTRVAAGARAACSRPPAASSSMMHGMIDMSR